MPKILIVASEASGDMQGAALMAELNQRLPSISWCGVGGPAMQTQGLVTAFPQSDLAVMGIFEVIPAIPRILSRLNLLKALAIQKKPDLVITIDGQDFSKRLAQKLKYLGVPHVHYVAPKVWAWRPGRAKKLNKLYTHLLCNLPFEAPWFAAASIPTTYVGHPMVERLAQVTKPAATALQLALLPGSRASELARHWPLMLATYRRLKQLIPALSGLLVLPDTAALARCQMLAPWQDDEGLEVVVGEARFAALAQCKAALAKSGTNNLELALLSIPAVVCYRMHWLTYWLAKKLVKLPSVSLPNLILNPPDQGTPCQSAPHQRVSLPHSPQSGPVYPEFIQAAAKPENLARALYPLLTQSKPGAAQQSKLAHIKIMMQTPQPAAQRAATVVLGLLKT